MGREGLVDNWAKNKKKKYEKTDKDGRIGWPGAVVMCIRGGQQGLPKNTFIVFLVLFCSNFWQNSSYSSWGW